MTIFPSTLPVARTPDPTGAPRLRWGILGPGGIARDFTDAAVTRANQELVAVGSRSVERAEKFGSQFNIPSRYGSAEQLVNDDTVQAVYVASPHSAHFEHALLAIRAGKHVLVEKAFTENAVQAAELVDAAADAGVMLMEAMWSRFLPGMDVIRQLIADGVLGDIHTVIADHGQYFDFDPNHRLFAPHAAGGALLDLGVYPVSFASFVLGAPESVTAVADFTTTGVDGQVSAVLRRSGAHAMVNASLFARSPTTATVSGTAARIQIGRFFYAPAPIVVTSVDGEELTYDGGSAEPLHLSLAYEIAHFAALAAGGAQESPILSLSETVHVMATMDEIRRQIGLQFPDESSPGVPATTTTGG